MKTFQTILKTRPWVRFIDDERGDGNGIIVVLSDKYDFVVDPGCGSRGFDLVKEVLDGTRKSDVFLHNRKSR